MQVNEDRLSADHGQVLVVLVVGHTTQGQVGVLVGVRLSGVDAYAGG